MIQYFYLFFFIIYLKNHQARVQTIFLFDIIGKITRDVEHVYMLMQHKKKKIKREENYIYKICKVIHMYMYEIPDFVKPATRVT